MGISTSSRAGIFRWALRGLLIAAATASLATLFLGGTQTRPPADTASSLIIKLGEGDEFGEPAVSVSGANSESPITAAEIETTLAGIVKASKKDTVEIQVAGGVYQSEVERVHRIVRAAAGDRRVFLSVLQQRHLKQQ